MPVFQNILQAIGNVPLVRLNKVAGPDDASVYAKCEFMNPGGSVKDRMAMFILDKAEREGRLRPGGTIVENTSGNTGMGVALWAAVKGYRCVFTMPDKMSTEKINALKAFGAEVVVTPTNVAAEDPRSYYETAKRIHRETPGSFMLNQYHNPDNIEAHYRITGPEIEKDCRTAGFNLDFFVAGLGTGGTMSGAGKYLKEKFRGMRNIGADPEGSVYLDYFKTGKLIPPHVYKVEGIGEDMLGGKRPPVYTVKATDHAKHAVDLMKRHGVSQLPVVEAGNKPVAMLHEVDLLQALIDGRHRLDEPISAVMKPLAGVVTPRTPVSRLKDLFATDHVAIVKDGDQLAAIVTKIDLIDWLGTRVSVR